MLTRFPGPSGRSFFEVPLDRGIADRFVSAQVPLPELLPPGQPPGPLQRGPRRRRRGAAHPAVRPARAPARAAPLAGAADRGGGARGDGRAGLGPRAVGSWSPRASARTGRPSAPCRSRGKRPRARIDYPGHGGGVPDGLARRRPGGTAAGRGAAGQGGAGGGDPGRPVRPGGDAVPERRGRHLRPRRDALQHPLRPLPPARGGRGARRAGLPPRSRPLPWPGAPARRAVAEGRGAARARRWAWMPPGAARAPGRRGAAPRRSRWPTSSPSPSPWSSSATSRPTGRRRGCGAPSATTSARA